MQLTSTGPARRVAKVLTLLGTAALSATLGLASSIPSISAQPAPRLAAGKSVNPATELQKLQAAAQSESKATFDITYTSASSSSSSSQVTFAQKPPDELFKSGTSVVIYNGKTTYYCSSEKRGTDCASYGSIGDSPLAMVFDVYSASTYIPIMEGWDTIISAGIPGFHIGFTSTKFAGQPSECVTWSYKGSSAKYCVTNSGILAYVGGSSSSSSSTFSLTSYSAHVSNSDFKLPRGLKITKI